jgi:hypothetical protein
MQRHPRALQPEPASHAAWLQRWVLSCRGCRYCIASRTAPAHRRSSLSRRGCTTSWCALLVAARTPTQVETLSSSEWNPFLIGPHAARQRSTVPESPSLRPTSAPSSDLSERLTPHLGFGCVGLSSLRPSHATRRRWREPTTTSRPLCCTRQSTTGAEPVRRLAPSLATRPGSVASIRSKHRPERRNGRCHTHTPPRQSNIHPRRSSLCVTAL